MIIAQILTSSSPFATTDSNVYALSGALLWIFLFASLLGSKQHLWYPYHGAWALALVADVVISGLEATDFLPSNSMEWAQLSLRIFRIIVIMLMLVLFFALGRLSYSEDEEALPLLGASNASENSHVRGSTYGSIDTTESDENAALETNDDEAARSERETKEKLALLKARLRENGSWWTYLKGFSVSFLDLCVYFSITKAPFIHLFFHLSIHLFHIVIHLFHLFIYLPYLFAYFTQLFAYFT